MGHKVIGGAGMRKGILFDLDGVICFTDQYHYRAWKSLADRLGIYFDAAINDRLRGVGRMESLDIILEKSEKIYSEQEKKAFADEKNEIYKELLRQMTPEDLPEEVSRTLKELRRRKVLMAIGSSSKNTRLILKQIGLDGFFDAVIDGNRIKNSKPDPEVFIKAAEALGLAREECLVVEDAKAGIEAAHAGNIKAAAIGKIIDHTDAEYRLGGFGDLLNIVDEGAPPEHYARLLETLREHSEYVGEGNYLACEKPFLGKTRGYFDPLVAAERAKPDKVYTIPDSREYKGIPVGVIRQTDGWNNFDISGENVETQVLEIPVKEKIIRAECYRKRTGAAGEKGCLIFFHGGGFVSGSVDVVRNICKGIADAGDICVLNVEYSLAPEFPYPRAIEEGTAVVEYAAEHAAELGIHAKCIGVAGDSAGGNIAGAVTIRDKREGRNRICYQALLYPAVVLDQEREEALCPWSESLYEIAEDDQQIRKAMNYIKNFMPDLQEMYLRNTGTANEDVSLLCHTQMDMLPATFLVTAEYDYLRIQDECYARRLAEAGVDVRIVNYKGMDHAFLDKVGYYPQAEDCIRMLAEDFHTRVSGKGAGGAFSG